VRVRKALLQTTMLAGIVGVTYLSAQSALADERAFTPNYVAVDGFNGKIEGLGGSRAGHAIYGSRGALSIPLNGPWGVQIDGGVGSWDSEFFYSVGGHLFWRDPAQALFGVYVNHLDWSGFGGLNVTQVAAEGEYYWQRWTLQGVVGVEFGNSSTVVTTTPPIPTVVGATAVFIPGVTTTTTYDIDTRFFDQINLKYYFADNAAGYVGHRYLGGLHAAALGGEVAMPVGGGRMASAFIEGRIGESGAEGVWGGLKMYFGQKDKPLIARHREDDPVFWDIGAIQTIAAEIKRAVSSAVKFCPPNTTIQTGGLVGFC